MIILFRMCIKYNSDMKVEKYVGNEKWMEKK